jgi:glycosyltransferase involved in cell wall biosynthesis
MSARTSVVFLTRSLEAGGAEVQLASLATALPQDQFAVTVLCFYEIGPLLDTLKEAGIPVVSLRKAGRWDVPRFFARLVKELRALRPDVIHAFLGPPNILATLAKFFLPSMRVVWGVRASNMDLSQYDFTWRLGFAFERWLSSRADLIVANSAAGRDHVRQQGFAANRLTVVPNGIDTARFDVSRQIRGAVRRDWGVADDECLIGLAARLDPMKDHENFLRAAALLVSDTPRVRFVCIGGDGLAGRGGLRLLADELGIGEQVIWAGYRKDMAAVLSALDIHTSASAFGEGFSNTVAESMAAGVPNAVTDVGDSALIVGNTGEVVPPRDPARLADAWRALLNLDEAESRQRRVACKARIAKNFSRATMVDRMAALYLDPDGLDKD